MRTKNRIYNSLCLGAEFIQWTRPPNLQKCWSSFLVSEMFSSDKGGAGRRWGRGKDRKIDRQYVFVFILCSFLCVFVCVMVKLPFFCVYTCVMTQLFSSCVRLREPVCICVCVSLFACTVEPSRAWTSVWQESTASVHYSPNYHSSILWKVLRIRTHLHWGLVRLIQRYVIYLQLSRVRLKKKSHCFQASLPPAMWYTTFKNTDWGCVLAYRLVFSRQSLQRNKKEESEQVERERTYLLTEDQLVIKEEEDSLLATSIRLIDPWQLPSVDELRAPVQDIIPLDKHKHRHVIYKWRRC